MQQFHEGNRL